MLTWILIILYSSLCASDSAYECGPHGKFEYCIDGVPGCVIGCHCHPGYYFDTDTKICEPNVKLSLDYRRHFIPIEPTRVQNIRSMTLPTPVAELITKDPIDAKVDEITNDADDLGDWLYNQFFKTIENQVINKTNGEKDILTRRSGVQIKKPVRRSHKHMRSRKNKRTKKNNLKSKLLRITEDDSLFESSSESDDDDTSASESSDTSDSDERDRDRDRPGRKKDKNHGHKKIVIYNKKPRPPLPSFIFLPNMESPFFPPIGLSPPAVPMYPMIPVPPVMGPPMYPYPGPPVMPPNGAQDPNHNGVTEPAQTAASPAIQPATQPATVPAEPSEEDVPDDAEPVQTAAPEGETPPEPEATVEPAAPAVPAIRNRQKYSSRIRSGTRGGALTHLKPKNKLLQKLRDKILRKKKLENYLAEQQMEAESPIMDENLPVDAIPNSEPMKVTIERPQSRPDFKYLTELIHKMDANGSARGNIVNALAENNVPIPVPVPAPSPGRRYNYKNAGKISQSSYPLQQYLIKNNTRTQRINMDDSYYANLGKQIASMIKNIDHADNHDIEVEIQPRQETPMLQPVFNDNTNYGGRSYWERSVRSPIKYVEPYKDNSRSEEHLLNLENAVETAASTVRNLNLQELETIIANMNKPKAPPKRANILANNLNNIIIEPSRISFILNNIYSKNNETDFIKRVETKSTTVVSTNILNKPTLKPVLLPDVFSINKLRRQYNHPTTEPQVIYNNPYYFQPTRQPNAIPVNINKFDQSRYYPDHLKYNADRSNYNLEQSKYKNEKSNYNSEQSKYNSEQYKYDTEQLKYYPQQLKNNVEQAKYNPEQTRYQNNEGSHNFPIPNQTGQRMFANSYHNSGNLTKTRHNPKPLNNPPIYYHSANSKNNYVFEKPTLPIHLQSLTRKITPFIKKFEPYSYFQHQFDDDF